MTYIPGPFNGPHMYLQWGGVLPGGEIWSNGVRMAPAVGVEPNYDEVVHTGYKNYLSAWFGRPTSAISPRALLTFVKYNKIGVDGKYADEETHEQVLASIPGGGNAGYTPANQIAIAISLTTDVVRGVAHRGRFYSPLPTLMVGIDGLITAIDQGNVKASAQQLLADLNSVTNTVQVAVMSRKAGNPGSRFVTGIQVGRVLDTQRRRRNAMAEKYV